MNVLDEFTQDMRRLRQDPQAVARSVAAAGRRVVGYVGNDIPVALIIASGALPVLRTQASRRRSVLTQSVCA